MSSAVFIVNAAVPLFGGEPGSKVPSIVMMMFPMGATFAVLWLGMFLLLKGRW